MEEVRMPLSFFESEHIDWIDRALTIFSAEEVAQAFLEMFPEFRQIKDLTHRQVVKIIHARLEEALSEEGRPARARVVAKKKEMMAWLESNADVFAVWNPITQLRELEQLRQNMELTVSERLRVLSAAMNLREKYLGTPSATPSFSAEVESPWQNEGNVGLTKFGGKDDGKTDSGAA